MRGVRCQTFDLSHLYLFVKERSNKCDINTRSFCKSGQRIGERCIFCLFSLFTPKLLLHVGLGIHSFSIQQMFIEVLYLGLSTVLEAVGDRNRRLRCHTEWGEGKREAWWYRTQLADHSPAKVDTASCFFKWPVKVPSSSFLPEINT